MERENRRSILGEHIAEILRPADTFAKPRNNLRAAASKSLICGGMALMVMAPVRVEAIGLGEITVQSTLGRPLQAVVPMHVGKGETLPANCVAPGKGRGELSGAANLRVRSPVINGPGTYNLRISTPNSLYEPMYELSLVINCPGTPILVRHYVFMLDLPGAVADAPAIEGSELASSQAWPVQEPETADQTPTPTRTTNPSARSDAANAGSLAPADPTRALDESADPIDAGTLYRVRRGDTLSTIANRIDGRLPNATWAVAGRLFATNPEAFIRNNADLIKLGSLIRIPDNAELASIAPSSSAGFTRQSAATIPDPGPVPAPRPSVDTPSLAAPRAESSNSDAAFAQDQAGALVLESNTAPADMTDDVYQEITADGVENAALASAGSVPFSDANSPQIKATADAALTSPFVDEATANLPAESDIRPQAEPVNAAAVTPPAEGKINPLVAIGVGLLLGLAIGALMLRRRFLTFVVNVLPSRDFIGAIAARIIKPRSTANTRSDKSTKGAAFNTRVASTLFDTRNEASGSSEPLQIGDPMEKTYIVEGFEEDSTQAVGERLRQNTDTSLNEKLEEPAEVTELSPSDKSEEDLLAEIFEEIPFDGTGEFATGPLEPTSKLPKTPENEIFDPSGELPQQLVDVIIDPTASMPIDPLTGEDSSLTQAFTEELEEMDPAPFEESVQIDQTAETAESERITNPAAEEISLDALPKGTEEDDEMSKTLYDALTLLERDYEDEFTASQILERSAIKKSLATMDEQTDDDAESIDEELAG